MFLSYLFKSMRAHLLFTLIGIAVFTLPIALIVKHHARKSDLKLRHIEKMVVQSFERSLREKQQEATCYLPVEAQNQAGIALPKQLSHIALADDLGILEKTTTVSIKGVEAAYNGSLIKGPANNYFLFYRYDILQLPSNPTLYHTYIGMIELDRTFKPIGEPVKIETGSDFSEDPRIAKIGDDYILSYNDVVPASDLYRTIRICKWDPHTRHIHDKRELDLKFKPIEKNWIPFAHSEEGQPSKLHMVYSISPHKVLEIPSRSDSKIKPIDYYNPHTWDRTDWHKKWGYLSGSTPAVLINGEYLSFFHSWFRESNQIWYVMGAYTFEAKAPFRITSMTKFPLLFTGMYSSRHLNTANAHKLIVFPAGLTVEERGDQKILHISYGENDSAIKIASLNYKMLKKFMPRCKLYPEDYEDAIGN